MRKRHETVHRPDPSKQRRRARRGVLPRSRMWSASLESRGSTSSLSSEMPLSLDGDLPIDLFLASVEWDRDDLWMGNDSVSTTHDLVAQCRNPSISATSAPEAPATFISQVFS